MTESQIPDASSPDNLAVYVEHLNFDFGGPAILQDVNLALPRGSRCLLVGANGAGKTTLLRILAGKRMVKSTVKVLGTGSFSNPPPMGVTYLGTEWASNPVTRSDIRVDHLIRSIGGDRYPERRDLLVSILDVDETWHMHEVSDGERRRVQLVLGLLKPWDLLLLDEVTVDLDVLVRAEFLQFLKRETEERNATIVYATHIFDGIGEWPTHFVRMVKGTVVQTHEITNFPEFDAFREYHQKHRIADSPLMAMCLTWLKQDRALLRREKLKNKDEHKPTRWEELSEDMKTFGDRYYNYWKNY
ncbi:uncharacterized protein VTP21DRAFT_4359 [Calcarisporiella thermophila]|uniref:uncharacterized protein n=1 Tax=Calcarisporiella thermophila TaxID=911321 RepID=UPI0037433B40